MAHEAITKTLDQAADALRRASEAVHSGKNYSGSLCEEHKEAAIAEVNLARTMIDRALAKL